MENKKVYKESGVALIPFIIFIVLLVGSGIVLSLMGVERPFYQVPASVAVFAAIVIAFVIYKGTVDEKVDAFIKGCSNENIAIMYMTCFLAGSFATVAKWVCQVFCVSFEKIFWGGKPPQFFYQSHFWIFWSHKIMISAMRESVF